MIAGLLLGAFLGAVALGFIALATHGAAPPVIVPALIEGASAVSMALIGLRNAHKHTSKVKQEIKDCPSLFEKVTPQEETQDSYQQPKIDG